MRKALHTQSFLLLVNPSLALPYIPEHYFKLTHKLKSTFLTESAVIQFYFSSFLHSHPSLAANSPRPVCVEGLKQSRCRQRAGYAERSGGLHAAPTCATPSGTVTNGFKQTRHANVIKHSSQSFPCLTFAFTRVVLGVGDVHPSAAAVSQRERGQVEEIVQADC